MSVPPSWGSGSSRTPRVRRIKERGGPARRFGILSNLQPSRPQQNGAAVDRGGTQAAGEGERRSQASKGHRPAGPSLADLIETDLIERQREDVVVGPERIVIRPGNAAQRVPPPPLALAEPGVDPGHESTIRPRAPHH